MSCQSSDFSKDLADVFEAIRFASNNRPPDDPLYGFLERLVHGSIFTAKHFANGEYEQELLDALTAMEHL